MRQRSVCVLGGPDSGKSTYLGALASAVQAELPGLFRMDTLAEDTRALERLEGPLLDGCYPQRTQSAEAPVLRMNLEGRSPLPVERIALSIGDYAGETIERLFRDRTRGWTDEWQARAEVDGLLLFIRPPAVMPLPRLEDATGGSALGGGGAAVRLFGEGLRAQEAPRSPKARSDEPVRMPTELALIELLQFLRFVRGLSPGERPATNEWRIGVMISAWDDVSDDWRQRGPQAYLEEVFPLLEDYLWSNFRPDAVQRFGLSSTGGDLNQPGGGERYISGELKGFITWSGLDGRLERRDDIALPLAWSLYGEQAFRESPQP